MLTAEDGIIRRSLFNDNVRDYQGTNSVNSEIEQTIVSSPESFILLNNGITVVCSKYFPRNRVVTLENPQIVNGCQTSSVLFDAANRGSDISAVTLAIKVIATNGTEVINSVVRGTNRQNIVHDVAFETTRTFHKLLEDFFNDYDGSNHRIYYERRSKQYQHDETIKYHQRISFKKLIQTYVGMFFNKPHMSHRHEYKLLTTFQNVIFQDGQNMLPYYTASLASHILDKLLQDSEIERKTAMTFRNHVLMIFREQVSGTVPDMNTKQKTIDDYCKSLIECLNDLEKSRDSMTDAISFFEEKAEEWLSQTGFNRDGLKDSETFSSYLLSEISGSTNRQSPINLNPTGMVIKIGWDKYGKQYGFIKRGDNHIFFHSDSSENLDFRELVGKTVRYELTTDPVRNNEIATNVQQLSN